MLASAAPASPAPAHHHGEAAVLPIEPGEGDTFELTHSTSSSAPARAPDRAARRVVSSLAQYRSQRLGRHLQRSGGERRLLPHRARPRALLDDDDRWALPVAIVVNDDDRSCAIAVPDASVLLHSYDGGGALGQLLVHESLFWAPDAVGGRLPHRATSLVALLDYYTSGEALADWDAIESVMAQCGSAAAAVSAEPGDSEPHEAARGAVGGRVGGDAGDGRVGGDAGDGRVGGDAGDGASGGDGDGTDGGPLASTAPPPPHDDEGGWRRGRLWRRLRRRLQAAIRKDPVALLSCSPVACWKPR